MRVAEGALFREPDAGRLELQQRELPAGRDVLDVHVLVVVGVAAPPRQRARMPASSARPNDARRSSNVLQRDLITSPDTTPPSCPGPSRAQSPNTASRASTRPRPRAGHRREAMRAAVLEGRRPERSGPRRGAWPPRPGRSSAAGIDAPRAPHRRAWGNCPPTAGARARRRASRSHGARRAGSDVSGSMAIRRTASKSADLSAAPGHRRRRVVR